MNKFVNSIAAAVIGLASQCLVAGVNPALPVSTVERSSKPIVLVFIANETDASAPEAANNSVLVDWLKDFGGKGAVGSAANIQYDVDHFKRFIDADVAAIKTQVVGGSSRVPLSAIIFTNRLAKAGSFEYYRSGVDYSVRRGAFPRVRDTHFITDNNPFSSEGAFREALRLTAGLFSPDKFRFVLMTKSHGSLNAMMRPKVMVDTDKLNEAEFHRRLHTLPEMNALAAAPVVAHKGGLGSEGRTGNESYEDALDLETVGLTKDQYVESLIDARADTGLRFDLAFAFACNSQLSMDHVARLRRGGNAAVGLFFGSDPDGLDYDEIQLKDAFVGVNASSDFIAALTTMLNDRATH